MTKGKVIGYCIYTNLNAYQRKQGTAELERFKRRNTHKSEKDITDKIRAMEKIRRQKVSDVAAPFVDLSPRGSGSSFRFCWAITLLDGASTTSLKAAGSSYGLGIAPLANLSNCISNLETP